MSAPSLTLATLRVNWTDPSVTYEQLAAHLDAVDADVVALQRLSSTVAHRLAADAGYATVLIGEIDEPEEAAQRTVDCNAFLIRTASPALDEDAAAVAGGSELCRPLLSVERVEDLQICEDRTTLWALLSARTAGQPPAKFSVTLVDLDEAEANVRNAEAVSTKQWALSLDAGEGVARSVALGSFGADQHARASLVFGGASSPAGTPRATATTAADASSSSSTAAHSAVAGRKSAMRDLFTHGAAAETEHVFHRGFAKGAAVATARGLACRVEL